MYSPEYDTFDFTGYQQAYQEVLSGFTKEKAKSLILNRLDQKIQIGKKSQNYLGYFTNEEFLKEIELLGLPYLKLLNTNYLYIYTDALTDSNRSNAKKTVKKLLEKWQIQIPTHFDDLFLTKEWRYVKIVS